MVFLNVEDNGCGFDENDGSDNSEGMGFTLIQALTEQLRAESSYQHINGFSFSLKAPRESNHK